MGAAACRDVGEMRHGIKSDSRGLRHKDTSFLSFLFLFDCSCGARYVHFFTAVSSGAR